MPLNLDPGRQNHQDLTLVEVFVQDRRSYARCRCKCGKLVKIALSKWRLVPPERCIKCSVRRNRIAGGGPAKAQAGGRTMKTLGEIETTERGFEVVRFKDFYDADCSLQQSSLAEYEPPGTSAIWLGCEGKRMHLNLEQVEALITHLQAWLVCGSFGGVR